MEDSQADQIHTIQLLQTNELTMNQLYKMYAETFSEYEWLWSKLIDDEKRHARWLDTIQRKLQEEQYVGVTILSRLSSVSVRTFIEYIRAEIQNMQDQKTSLEKALSVTILIERGMIEKRFFASSEEIPQVFKQIMNNLIKETTMHQQLVEEAHTAYNKKTQPQEEKINVKTVLKRCSEFSELTDAELAILAQYGALKQFSEGDTIYTKGTSAQGKIALIMSGRVGVIAKNGKIIRGMGQSEIIGEIGAIKPQGKRTLTVEALESSNILEWDIGLLRKKIPALSKKLTELAWKRMANYSE